MRTKGRGGGESPVCTKCTQNGRESKRERGKREGHNEVRRRAGRRKRKSPNPVYNSLCRSLCVEEKGAREAMTHSTDHTHVYVYYTLSSSPTRDTVKRPLSATRRVRSFLFKSVLQCLHAATTTSVQRVELTIQASTDSQHKHHKKRGENQVCDKQERGERL